MVRNMKSRKLRNRKIRGGGLFCGNWLFTAPCAEAPNVNTEGVTQPQVQPGEVQDQPKVESVQPQQANAQVQSEQANTQVHPQLRGGKSNRRRNKKSKKSRRTRRR